MNQEQIQVAVIAIDFLDTVQTLLIRRFFVVCRRDSLAGDENILSRKPGIFNGFPDFRFVAVDLCRVDMTIADFQSLLTRLDCKVFRAVPDSEAQDR